MDQHSNADAIISSLSNDEEMAELIDFFVAELPDRVAALEAAFREQSWDTLRRMAHQLKGAAPSYGFEPIGQAAGRLESVADPEVGLDRMADAVDELLSLCRRVVRAPSN